MSTVEERAAQMDEMNKSAMRRIWGALSIMPGLPESIFAFADSETVTGMAMISVSYKECYKHYLAWLEDYDHKLWVSLTLLMEDLSFYLQPKVQGWLESYLQTAVHQTVMRYESLWSRDPDAADD